MSPFAQNTPLSPLVTQSKNQSYSAHHSLTPVTTQTLTLPSLNAPVSWTSCQSLSLPGAFVLTIPSAWNDLPQTVTRPSPDSSLTSSGLGLHYYLSKAHPTISFKIAVLPPNALFFPPLSQFSLEFFLWTIASCDYFQISIEFFILSSMSL